MSLDIEVQKIAKQRAAFPFAIRDMELPKTLVLVAAATRGNPGPLIDVAQAQFREEFPKYGVTNPHEAIDMYGLMNCFGTVFLAHEVTGRLKDEVRALEPLVERVTTKSAGEYHYAERAYLSALYAGLRRG